jgi:DNA-binding transcriptional LysR family regulator
MELRHLRYFIAVAEELHFGRAALRLHLAQPPLSQQIKGLERELGVTLFTRTSRVVTLTEAGRMFLDQAYLVVGQAEKATATMHAVRRGHAGRLSIGVIPSTLYSFIPAILREFHIKRPDVELRCYDMNTGEQLEALLDRRIQLGFFRQIAVPPEICTELLFCESLILAVPITDPRAAQRQARLEDFAEDEFVMFPRDRVPVIYDAVIASCKRAGFSPSVAQETAEVHMMLALTAAGVGICLVPESIRNLPFPGIAYLPLGDQQSEQLEVSLAWRVDDDSTLLRAALEVARAVSRVKT